MEVFVSTYVHLMWTRIAGLYSKSMFSFARNCQAVFQSACHILHSHQQWTTVFVLHILTSICCDSVLGWDFSYANWYTVASHFLFLCLFLLMEPRTLHMLVTCSTIVSYIQVPCCCFNLQFPNDTQDCWASFHMFICHLDIFFGECVDSFLNSPNSLFFFILLIFKSAFLCFGFKSFVRHVFL